MINKQQLTFFPTILNRINGSRLDLTDICNIWYNCFDICRVFFLYLQRSSVTCRILVI